MPKVREEATPPAYKNGGFLDQIDFYDTFATTNHENNLEEITHLVFNNPPLWIQGLFKLRNKLVKLIGLKTEKPADYHEDFSVGGYIGFFKIISISDSAIVLGAEDSHLDFRVIVATNDDSKFNIKVMTLVQYNNSVGKIYMALIKPFHRMVVKQMVKNAYLEGPAGNRS